MTRVLIVGNSHVVALREAWARRPGGESDITVAFFAAPTHILARMRLSSNRTLRLPANIPEFDEFAKMLTRINGGTSVDLTNADHVLHVGSNCAFGKISAMLGEFAVDGHPSSGLPRRLSRAAFDAMALDISKGALPKPEWFGWAAPRLMLMPRPVASETALEDTERSKFRVWSHAAKSHDAFADLLDRYFDQVEAAMNRRGITFLRQPCETMTRNGVTRAQYTSAAQSRGFPFSDHTHMNAEYGSLCLDAAFALIRNTTDKRAAAAQPELATATT